MSTCLVKFPLNVSQGSHSEPSIPASLSLLSAVPFFLGNLEVRSRPLCIVRAETNLELCSGEGAEQSHTLGTALPSCRRGKALPQLPNSTSGCYFVPLHLACKGGGHGKKEGKQQGCGLFPPGSTLSTFSKSLLPSFASPVNAIKHTFMPSPLGT